MGKFDAMIEECGPDPEMAAFCELLLQMKAADERIAIVNRRLADLEAEVVTVQMER